VVTLHVLLPSRAEAQLSENTFVEELTVHADLAELRVTVYDKNNAVVRDYTDRYCSKTIARYTTYTIATDINDGAATSDCVIDFDATDEYITIRMQSIDLAPSQIDDYYVYVPYNAAYRTPQQMAV
jgi:hypothetical protein